MSYSVNIPDFTGTLLQGAQTRSVLQDLADQQGLRAAASAPGALEGNPEALSGLLRYGPRGVQLAQTIQQRADQQRGQIREQLPLIAGMLEGATPETWGEVRQRALAAGLSPSILPEQFDANRVAGLTRAAQAARAARAADAAATYEATLPGRMAVAAAGRTNVNVRLPPMENSFAQRAGTDLATEAGELASAGARSGDTLRQLRRFEQGMERFTTGTAAGARLTIGQAAQMFGIPDSALPAGINRGAVASGEEIRALTGQMLAGMIGPGGFPAQNFSNADREMLERSLPSIANTPEGNRALLAAARAAAERNVEVARAWREWQQQNGVSADSYLRFQRDRLPQIRERDIIAPLMPRPTASASGVPGPGGVGTAAPPPGGQAPVRVRTPEEARRLPRGTVFLDPNGVERVVP